MKRIVLTLIAAMALSAVAYAQEEVQEENPYLGYSFTARSGLTWAQSNLGASEPQEVGDSFRWAEYATGAFIDISFDPARNTLGGDWRMPTFDEWGELVYSYKWDKIKDGDATIWHIHDNGENHLFLPKSSYWANCKYNDTPARNDAAWIYNGQMMFPEDYAARLPIRPVMDRK